MREYSCDVIRCHFRLQPVYKLVMLHFVVKQSIGIIQLCLDENQFMVCFYARI